MIRRPSRTSATPKRYRFGEFCLDEIRGALLLHGAVIELRPKTYEVLVFLVRHAGELQCRDDIIENVWKGAQVSDNSVDQCIFEARRALGDQDHTLIRTIPRRGFLFESRVDEVLGSAPLSAVSRAPGSKALAWGSAATAVAAVSVLVMFVNSERVDEIDESARNHYALDEVPTAFRDTEQRSLDSQPNDSAAFDSYLLGLYYLRQIENGGNEASGEHAVELLQISVDLDPDWAPSRAALGRALHFLASGGAREDGDARYEESRHHLETAVLLDPGYGPAYASLAYVNMRHDRDLGAAERNYRLAAANGFPGHWGRALFFRMIGQVDEAIVHFREAIPLYPQAKYLRWQFAETLLCAGRYEESERMFLSIGSFSDTSPIFSFLAYIAAKTGRMMEAHRLLDQHTRRTGSKPDPSILALVGQREAAEAALASLEADESWHLLDHLRTTQALGEPLRSLDYIEAAAAADVESIRRIQCPEALGSIIDNPRYQRLINSSIYNPGRISIAAN